jgi:hypothetical protein
VELQLVAKQHPAFPSNSILHSFFRRTSKKPAASPHTPILLLLSKATIASPTS